MTNYIYNFIKNNLLERTATGGLGAAYRSTFASTLDLGLGAINWLKGGRQLAPKAGCLGWVRLIIERAGSQVLDIWLGSARLDSAQNLIFKYSNSNLNLTN